MRLIYVPTDNFLSIDGKNVTITNPDDVPDELHAIQIYNNGTIEVEWADKECNKCLGNTNSYSGLPHGYKFIEELINIHKITLNKEKFEKVETSTIDSP